VSAFPDFHFGATDVMTPGDAVDLSRWLVD